MSKKQQIFVLSCIAMIAVIAYLLMQKTDRDIATPSAQPQEAIPFKEDTDAYSIQVTYPAFNESLPGAKAANATIKASLDNSIASFKKEAENSLKAPIDLPADIVSTVTGSSHVEYETDRFVSMYFGAEWYLRGAAHPYHTINTYIFDKKLGKLIDITDLFKPYSNYLEFFSHYAYADLIKQSETGDTGLAYDKQMLQAGTQGTYDNFHLALPTKDGLVIYFPEYQVGPYAAGSQQVVIPYDKLQSYINSEGALSMYLK